MDPGFLAAALVLGCLGALSWLARGPSGSRSREGRPGRRAEWNRGRRARRERPVAEPVLADGDEADLDDLFERAIEDLGHDVEVLLAARLQPLVRRSVPVRAVRPAPGRHTARICFADGTVVLARSQTPGDLARLVMALHSRPVRLESCARDERGTRLVFRWPGDNSLVALAVGLDQPA